MSFRIEKIFGMISVAILGFLAISCVPNVKDAPVKAPTEVIQEIPIDLEVDAVRQVEMMNALPSANSGPVFHTGPESAQF
jgi:hypothetical protein